MNYSSILEVYTLQQLLDQNNVSEEDCLEYLVESKFIELPEFQPLDL